MIASHHRAWKAIKSGPGKFPVGVSLAIQDEQARAILMQMAQVWFRLSERDDPASNDEGS